LPGASYFAARAHREDFMVTFIRSDLSFILEQILIAERQASGESLTDILPNQHVPWGLRTVDGSLNNLFIGQSEFGAADNIFPRMTTPAFLNEQDGDTMNLGPGGLVTNTDYGTPGNVADLDPRIVSNLLVDQTITNPAAVAAFIEAGLGTHQLDGNGDPVFNPDGTPVILDLDGNVIPRGVSLTATNVTPDEGLSAPFNAWMTFFGQFFDHGLDLVTKGGNGTVFVPLAADDPLRTHGPDGIAGNGDEVPASRAFMVVTRATNQPGPDGVLGTPDDIQEHTNTTSPFVDQNQTYSSHPSHQVFLRAYALVGGQPVDTGKLLTNRSLGIDGIFGNGNDVEIGGMATWQVLKAQARDILGINLTDADVNNVPLLATDAYGNFLRGPNGLPQVVVRLANGNEVLVEGVLNGVGLDLNNPLPLVTGETVVRTGHAFLDDIAHIANPRDSQTGALLTADADTVAGVNDGLAGTYDNELLDAHYVAGDGRVNENIGLTAVHAIFHSEHNRLVDHTKSVLITDAQQILASTGSQAQAVAFLNQWLLLDVATVPATPAAIANLVWDGQRLFQAAKFGTEMQYQHLVFEEFARTVQPNIDEFLPPEGYDVTIDPSIVAEFAHTVYRFGHSMLTETIDRLDPNFVSSEIGLIAAFLNPLAFAASGPTPDAATGAIVRGVTRQTGSEIDEFVVEALRNNLLGLPLDLPAINIARGRDTGIPSLNAARREFYDMTSDSQLKPYTSWADLVTNLKHAESLINFIAAYGTHSSITSATTLADKRAAATLIVLDGAGAPADRMDFLHSTGAWASLPNGVTTTGLDDIDFWIGGLAEKQMPFGGLLGSTFNFVFETQLEALQNGDRFYYLARTAGMNFINELENNSFAAMIMANSDVNRLPANVFSTPAWILEADRSRQHTGLDDPLDTDLIAGNSDPTGGLTINGVEVMALVMRDDPGTAGPDANYLRYTGVDHVVLGGTAGDDTLIGSIGDDSIWGDGGNDRLEGGDGVDSIEGGDGDDIITDLGGDDVIKGNEGNDVIQGGNGFNLLIGGGGNDFIITGEDVSDTFGGRGNDFILGAPLNLPTFGNEGDDWIEIGTSDGAGGDNFAPQEDGTVTGNDIFITDTLFDEVDGEGGDDIMVGSDGPDHFGGGGGYDWASYEHDPFGLTIDLNVNDFVEPPVTPSAAGILDRFAQVEGLSGSTFNDILRGDNADAVEIGAAGPQDSTLRNIALVSGLQGFLNQALGGPVSSFNAGNIILGGAGSDLIEGRGGNDIIDGDRWLNVRISVRANADGTGPEIDSFERMNDPLLMRNMLDGTWNPGQLVAVREILTGADAFDTAIFSGPLQSTQTFRDVNGNDVVLTVDNYDITTVGAVTTVRHLVYDRNLDAAGNPVVTAGILGADGEDRLINVERLQFGDETIVLALGENAEPVGLLTITDSNGGVPAINDLLTVSAAGVTDADNGGGGAITGPISYYWQSEAIPGSGVFEDIVTLDGARFTREQGTSLRVTADLDGLRLRVRAVYEDDNGTLENVFSNPTAPVAGGAPPAPPAALPVESPTQSDGVRLIRGDLQFILEQIMIAEQGGLNGEFLSSIIPNARLPFGLRTVDGTFNNLVSGQEGFGAADQNFPIEVPQNFRDDQDGDQIDINGGAPGGVINNTNYATTGPVNGNVVDADPRIISNLIADQTITNPAAVAAFLDAGLGTQDVDVNGDPILNPDGTPVIRDLDGNIIPRGHTLTIPNVTPDEGLSAPFNSWMTLFGQFFDHGLDLVNKGGNGTVFIPLAADDPLRTHGPDGIAGNGDEVQPQSAFMVLTRATNTAVSAGPDGNLGTADDIHFHNNQTTPFVDQNQTYTSHPSHQVFLREYVLQGGRPVATGRLLDGASGGLPTWAEVKAQALNILGVALDDQDVLNVPLVATDAYGRFLPGADGFVQIVTPAGLQSATSLAAPVDATAAIRTNHAFLDDIAHTANPRNSQTGAPLAPDANTVIGGPQPAGTYDDELLDRHFATGDGRGNENIGLTAVHHVFHAEHNRMVDHLKDVVLASNDVAFVNQWLNTPVATLPGSPVGLDWNGERVFQAARFTTEMQYQHLVFEEFARRVQPQVDIFLGEGQGYDTTIDPAILAEFAHTVYRFGHSMLTETVDRFNPDFSVVGGDHLSLVAAFLNPVAFNQDNTLTAEQAAGAIIRGMTRQAGNEIDEFVTEALRNNLLGLPLDLPTINIARGRDTGVPSLNAARRDFYSQTGDSQLKPYTSWMDLMDDLRHPASIINFIAAYGTHTALLRADVDTLAEKRAVATALVLGGDVTLDGGTVLTEATDFADRIAFLNSIGAWATPTAGPDAGITITGLDDIDFWIGGLAQRRIPIGGQIGSTFNFIFETQLENLQFADRFYYLERTAGTNFLTELENNSFAKLIMANTDTTHLPGDVFSTPAWILEVDRDAQFTGLDDPADTDLIAGNSDPTGGSLLTPLVIRDNPATAGLDTNYLRYTGEDHVVLGGTDLDDIIIASIGDDTLYGDGGNDRLEGGDGVDLYFAGDGDDIITDKGGEDNLQGQEGNDAIHAGNGIDLILGGFGNDFIVTGEDGDESFGGPGNDFILGDRADEMVFGNEGDDWIEWGTADGSAGENFDVRGLDATIGHDVFVGDSVSDRMGGEGGDDIMAGNGGQGDRYLGGSGFDWAIYEHDTLAANFDLNLRAFDFTPLPLSPASPLARFDSTEGLSGSSQSDILRGDDLDALGIANSGATGSVLDSAGMARINGLQALVQGMLGPVTSFGSGNIILGGDGSDILQGRGGNDLIEGDASLNVRISVRTNSDGTGPELFSVDSMRDLVDDVFSGAVNPGQLVIVREILSDTTFSYDTAVYSGSILEYEIFVNGILQPFGGPFNIDANDVVTVAHRLIDAGAIIPGSVGADGIDTLRSVERLQFADDTVILAPGQNSEPTGNLFLSDESPNVGFMVAASTQGVNDADNGPTSPDGNITGPVSYVWQVELRPLSGIFEDILIPTGLGDIRAIGPIFTPTADLVGLRLRVVAMYQDANGVIETVYSLPTLPVGTDPNNTAPVLLNPLADVTVPEDTNFSVVIPVNTFFDSQTPASELVLTVTLADGSPLPAGVRFDADTRTVSGRRDLNVNGPIDLRVTASDGVFTSPADTFTINIAPVNDAPVLAGLSNLTTREFETNGVVISDVLATDPDGDALIATLPVNSGGIFAVELDQSTGQWKLVVANGVALDFEQASNYGITLRVTDPSGLFDERTYNITAEDRDPETVRGTPNGEEIHGGELGDILLGLGGDDILVGNGNADWLYGGEGADQMQGDDGSDIVGIDNADTAYSGGNGFDHLVIQDAAGMTLNVSGLDFEWAGGGAGNDTLDATGMTTQMRLIGAGGTDTLTGGSANDMLYGGAENDVLMGGDGVDQLLGEDGDDTLAGGGNGDYLWGGQGSDTMIGGAGVDVFTGGDGDDLVFGGTENDYLYGGAGVDDLNGEAGRDIMAGGAENDLMNGGAGNDSLYGEDGDDNMHGGTGVDVMSGGAGADLIDGDEDNDYLYGGGDGDTLLGSSGVDVLSGEAGNDRVEGGAGVDYVFGGAGNDTFVIRLGTEAEVILDFTAGGAEDRLEFAGTGFTSFAQVQAAMSDPGNGYTIITLADASKIWIAGISPAGFTADDVIFS
jgi:Ca2+-binding RTX toxin-like protein